MQQQTAAPQLQNSTAITSSSKSQTKQGLDIDTKFQAGTRLSGIQRRFVAGSALPPRNSPRQLRAQHSAVTGHKEQQHEGAQPSGRLAPHFIWFGVTQQGSAHGWCCGTAAPVS
jgi:hypothetical protein